MTGGRPLSTVAQLVYNVHMKKYSVGILRERLAQALDEAERGVPVIVERRGVRYALSVEPRSTPRKARPPVIETLDRAIDDGQWTWDWSPAKVRLKTGGRR